MRFSSRLRQDPILLGTTIVMTLAVVSAVVLLAWWTFVLTPLYPPHPCAPDAPQKGSAWIISR